MCVAIRCARNGAAGRRECVNERSAGAGASTAISARLSVIVRLGAVGGHAAREPSNCRTRNTADAHRPVSKRDKHPRLRTDVAIGVPRALFRNCIRVSPIEIAESLGISRHIKTNLRPFGPEALCLFSE